MNEAELREKKKAARAAMQKRLAQLSRGTRAIWSGEIAESIRRLSCFAKASTLLGFLPMPDEVDTIPILRWGLEEGKSIFVPRMYGDEIKFHRLENLCGPWDEHPFGVREPNKDLPLFQPAARTGETLVVTPGLAFDTSGGRLGFGKGYYDRFIAHCRSVDSANTILFVGVCFRTQILEKIPAGEYDCILDGLISNSGIEFTTGGSRQL